MREPFAKVVSFGEGVGEDFRIEIEGIPVYCPNNDSGQTADKINAAVDAREKALLDKHTARIAELERVLDDVCELMDKCAGRLNVFVAQYTGNRDTYFVFELNRLSVCAGALDAMSRKATSIKSVLGKGE